MKAEHPRERIDPARHFVPYTGRVVGPEGNLVRRTTLRAKRIVQ